MNSPRDGSRVKPLTPAPVLKTNWEINYVPKLIELHNKLKV